MQLAEHSKPIEQSLVVEPVSFDDVKKYVLQAHYKAMIFDWCDPLHHIIKLKKNFYTACWAFLGGKHRIYIGDLIFSAMASGAEAGAYIKAFIFHEMAHGRYTSRDLAKVCRLLKEANVNFKLFNLFEDARIEDLWRKLTGTLFGWEHLMKPLNGIESPVSIFYALIHTEGDFYEPELEHYERVADYYERAISIASSEGLIPLLVEFINEFKPNVDDIPETGTPSSNGSGNADDGSGDDSGDGGHDYDDDIEGDLKFAVGVSRNGDLGGMDADTQMVVDSADDDKTDVKPGSDDAPDIDTGKPAGPTDKKEIQDNKARSVLNHSLLLSEPVEIDVDYANKQAMFIKSIFLGPARSINTDRPSKRLNKRHFGNPVRPMYSRKEDPGFKKLEVNLIIDCSGSMRGQPIKNARAIVSIFNRLALMGVFSARVILSESRVDDFPVLHLPLPDSEIGRIAKVRSAEGIERCMRTHLSEIKKADFNFVITDGNLADSPIDKRFYQSNGVYTIGLYACEHATPADLTDWFDMGIVRKDLDDLFSAMVNHIKRF